MSATRPSPRLGVLALPEVDEGRDHGDEEDGRDQVFGHGRVTPSVRCDARLPAHCTPWPRDDALAGDRIASEVPRRSKLTFVLSGYQPGVTASGESSPPTPRVPAQPAPVGSTVAQSAAAPSAGARSVPGEAAGETRGQKLVVIYGALMLALLLSALDQTIVSTALPTIVNDLGGLSHLSWVVTAYLLASTATTQVWGKLGDQYGRKYLFLGAIVIFLVGSALCGQSRNMGELIAFRAVQGIGGGGLLVLTQAIVGDIVPAATARQVPGRVRRGLRRRVRHRPAARRVLRRQPVLALGVLHQPADRRDRADRDRRGAPRRQHQAAAQDRLPRRDHARRVRHRRRARDLAGAAPRTRGPRR